MKFIPQDITCEKCGHQGKIITEDIHLKDLVIQLNSDTSQSEILAHVKCPSCHQNFDVLFKYKMVSSDETLYECEGQSNKGLKMWVNLKNGEFNTLEYQPSTSRSSMEQQLDQQCEDISDRLIKWKGKTLASQSLSDILGAAEDYTNSVSWKTFRLRHYLAVVCAEAGSQNTYIGYSGNFDTVKIKNQMLIDSFVNRLGGMAESESNQFCDNPIGHCAEMHGANRCLNNETNATLQTMMFSIARICRTGLCRSYCQNCLTLFPSLRNG